MVKGPGRMRTGSRFGAKVSVEVRVSMRIKVQVQVWIGGRVRSSVEGTVRYG